ncbi:tripartite tricarboxylate transporter TctB family protein [Pseudonocardia sp. NPDC046786]|uniref:tripartite tricarboxylate transporter TctB family protein n=1 Tax=Pseudonocardia sp. NPDC046786 TaxID=3155471 RepID=UPI0033D92F6F
MSGRPAHLSRGALVVPAILAGLGIFLVYGTVTMEVVGDGGLFGPTTMPWIVAVLCFVVAALLAFDILRPRPEYDTPAAGAADGSAGDSGEAGPAAPDGVNVPAVLTAVGGVAGFIIVLPFLGWILSATGLFTAVAVALGNRRWPGIVLGGLAVSSAVQVVFSALLGISLPSGFVGGF